MSYTTNLESERTNRNITLDQAIRRIYLIKDNGGRSYLSLPKCMIGRRIRISIVEDDKISASPAGDPYLRKRKQC